MVIAHNISATNTYNKMGISSKAADKNMEKLSSGYKINRAADDAAGLSISEKMRSQIRGLNQASENAENGISMIQTAEGALNEAHSILQRMRELAVQAANDTNAASDREALQSEIDQLTSEINRIGNTTEFNGMKLLDGSKRNIKGDEKVEVANAGSHAILNHGTPGISNTAKLALTTAADAFQIKADSGEAKTIFDNMVQGADKNTITVSKENGQLKLAIKVTNSGTPENTEQVYSGNFTYDATNKAYVYNNHGLTLKLTKDSVSKFLTNGSDTDTLKLDLFTYASSLSTTEKAADATKTTFTGSTTFKMEGEGYIFSVNDDYDEGSSTKATIKTLALTDWDDNSRIDYDKVAIKYTAKTTGATGTGIIEINYYSGSENVIKENYNVTLASNDLTYNANGLSFTIEDAGNLAAGEYISSTVDLDGLFKTSLEEGTGADTNNSVFFHVGANTNQVINTEFGDMRANALGLTGTGDAFCENYTVNNGTDQELTERGLNISTREGANKAIDIIDKAVTLVSKERSRYGSIQNRLEYTINNLDTTSENMTSAESTIRDVDMASEMMELTKNQILQQASQAMLTQAMQTPQQVLQLLQ